MPATKKKPANQFWILRGHHSSSASGDALVKMYDGHKKPTPYPGNAEFVRIYQELDPAHPHSVSYGTIGMDEILADEIGGQWEVDEDYETGKSYVITAKRVKSADEVDEETNPRDGDYIINGDGDVYEYEEGSGGKLLKHFGPESDNRAMYHYIKNRMDEKKYWGNVWYQGSRGDLELSSNWGIYLKSQATKKQPAKDRRCA